MVGIELIGNHPRYGGQLSVRNVVEDVGLRYRDVRRPFGTVAYVEDRIEAIPQCTVGVAAMVRRVVPPGHVLLVEQIAHRSAGVLEARKRTLIEQILTVRRYERRYGSFLSVASPGE